MASGNLAAGAQAGAAFGPWGAMAGAAIGGMTDVMGGANESRSNFDARSAMDGSGWTVSTGSSKATGGARTGGLDQGTSSVLPPSMAGLMGGDNSMVYIGLGVVLVALLLARRKGK